MTSPLGYYLANLAVYFLVYCMLTMGLNISFGMTGILDFAFITFHGGRRLHRGGNLVRSGDESVRR